MGERCALKAWIVASQGSCIIVERVDRCGSFFKSLNMSLGIRVRVFFNSPSHGLRYILLWSGVTSLICVLFDMHTLQAVLADLSTLKVMPLIQIFLFATAI